MKALLLFVSLTLLSAGTAAEDSPCSPLKIQVDMRGFQNVRPGSIEKAQIALLNPEQRIIESLSAQIEGESFHFHQSRTAKRAPKVSELASSCGKGLPDSSHWSGLGCKIDLEFSPQTVGRYDGTMTIRYQISEHICTRRIPIFGWASIKKYFSGRSPL